VCTVRVLRKEKTMIARPPSWEEIAQVYERDHPPPIKVARAEGYTEGARCETRYILSKLLYWQNDIRHKSRADADEVDILKDKELIEYIGQCVYFIEHLRDGQTWLGLKDGETWL
jgi:hypothetical protein